MAAADSFSTHPCASDYTIAPDRLISVFRAGGQKTASPTGRKITLVKTNNF